MKINKKLLVVAISTSLFSGNALAEDEKYKQLEDKINSLEKMLLSQKTAAKQLCFWWVYQSHWFIFSIQ